MLSDRDLNEMLKRVVAGGGDLRYSPSEVEDFRASIPPEPMGEELPKGTKVAFADDLDVAAPVSAAARMPIVPKVVDVPSGPEQDPDRLAAAAARAQDRLARQRMSMERGGRELIAGLTRTTPQAVTQQPTDAFERWAQAQRQKQQTAHQQQQERTAAEKVNFDRAEAARKAALHAQERQQDLDERVTDNLRSDEGQRLTKEGHRLTAEGNKIMQGIALQGAVQKKEEHEAKKKERDDKVAASDLPFLGGTLSLAPGLSDTDRGEARRKAGAWNAADAAVQNFQSALEDFARRPGVESKGRVTAALRTASSAFNAAIGGGAMSADEAAAMSEAMGADILKPEGLAAIGQSLFGDDGAAAASISNRVRAARQANRAAALGLLKTYGAYSEGKPATASAGPQRKTLKDGRVVEKHADGLWYPVGG